MIVFHVKLFREDPSGLNACLHLRNATLESSPLTNVAPRQRRIV